MSMFNVALELRVLTDTQYEKYIILQRESEVMVTTNVRNLHAIRKERHSRHGLANELFRDMATHMERAATVCECPYVDLKKDHKNQTPCDKWI